MDNNKGIEITIVHIHEQINRLNGSVEKLADNQSRMNEVLIRNTQIVDEHQRRSISLESWVDGLEKRLTDIAVSVGIVDKDVKRVDDEIRPIKEHVAEVTKIVSFIKGVSPVLKVILMLVTLISSAYGLFVFINSLKG